MNIYEAVIKFDGERISGGFYTTEEAAQEVCDREKPLWGDPEDTKTYVKVHSLRDKS